MKKIIIVSGATASGKTKTAVEFCKKHNGEIISCDSRQIYKYLDIGSNKEGILSDGFREIDGIKQRLTDILEPDEKYSAADFAGDADREIEQIIEQGKLPVIVGGTGLYIKSLLYGLDKMPDRNDALRKELSQKNVQKLYDDLLNLDKESAEKHRGNPQRLIRALEINILSGKTVSSHFEIKTPRYDFKHYSIKNDRTKLYERINQRCLKMLETGIIEETQKVLDMGFEQNCPAFNSIGYKQVLQFLNKSLSKEELLSEFCKQTRHYAKRQETWFRGQKDIEFIEEFGG